MVVSKTPCVRRISDHQRGEIARVLVGFGAQIGKIDVAIFQRRRRDDFEAGHDRAGGIGSVGRGGDEADVAMRFAARRVIFANGEQAGVFALRAGVGLQRDRRETGDFRQPVLQLLAHFRVAARLISPARTDAVWRIPATRSGTFPRWRSVSSCTSRAESWKWRARDRAIRALRR